MEVTIRDYETSDFKACRSLWGELTEHHANIYENPTIFGDDPGWGFDEYLSNPARRGAWVVELDGQVVGFTGLLISWGEGEIEPVVVSAPYRKKGIGTMLIQHACQEAKKMGVRFLSIRPVARNEKALALFVRLGFNIVGHVDLFQDLSSSSDREWQPGITIHGHELRY